MTESYKHSCPFCGQHIEYTVGYCGKQLTCPICGKIVTFPAIPPGSAGSRLRLKSESVESNFKWSFDLQAILAALKEFKHWNMVLIGLVPFGIVAALLIGASVVNKNLGSEPSMPALPPVQAAPNAWQTMTNLARAEQAVQDRIVAVTRAASAVATAERERDRLRAYYRGNTTEYNSRASDQAVENAQAVLAATRKSFDNAFLNYQKLGGTVDYRQQLP